MSTPVIPKRPSKSKDSEVSDDSISMNENSVRQIESPSLESPPTDSVLHSQMSEDENNDGDKTPGNSNTKISFKDDIPSDTELIGSDASSFNDDQETVKDKEQEAVDAELADDLDIQTPVESNTELDNADVQSGNSGSLMPIIPKRPKKKDLESDVSKSAKDTDVEPLPFIPKRPKKKLSKEDTTEANNDSVEKHPDLSSLKLVSGNTGEQLEDPKAVSNIVKITDDEVMKPPITTSSDKEVDTVDSGSPTKFESETNDSKTPLIPSRPKPKPKPSFKENIAVADSLETQKLDKKPPPKPKKLSSKIAAFQELLSQPKGESKEAFSNQSSGHNKLLNDKMSFAKNLQGIMGKGFALPGMIDPSKLKPVQDETTTDVGNDGGDDQEEEAERKQPSVRRAKGPKGKKLPKSLSKPVEIIEQKFQIESHNLWSITLKKKDDIVLDSIKADGIESQEADPIFEAESPDDKPQDTHGSDESVEIDNEDEKTEKTASTAIEHKEDNRGSDVALETKDENTKEALAEPSLTAQHVESSEIPVQASTEDRSEKFDNETKSIEIADNSSQSDKQIQIGDDANVTESKSSIDEPLEED